MNEVTLEQLAVQNIIKLVAEHKVNCKGHCNIDLVTILLWLGRQGIDLTEYQQEVLT